MDFGLCYFDADFVFSSSVLFCRFYTKLSWSKLLFVSVGISCCLYIWQLLSWGSILTSFELIISAILLSYESWSRWIWCKCGNRRSLNYYQIISHLIRSGRAARSLQHMFTYIHLYSIRSSLKIPSEWRTTPQLELAWDNRRQLGRLLVNWPCELRSSYGRCTRYRM